jgi:hypothetical protein
VHCLGSWPGIALSMLRASCYMLKTEYHKSISLYL